MSKKEKDPNDYTPLEVVHETMQGFYKAGAIDLQTMRHFDELCLPEVKKFSPKQIKKIRKKEKVSQPVFAKYLNLSASTVRQWELGERVPKGASLKLLNIVDTKGLNGLL